VKTGRGPPSRRDDDRGRPSLAHVARSDDSVCSDIRTPAEMSPPRKFVRSVVLRFTPGSYKEMTGLLSGPLVLRHARRAVPDYEVIDSKGATSGASSRYQAGPTVAWAWAITGAVVMPHLPSHGNCATREEAKAKFAGTWRAWLGLRLSCAKAAVWWSTAPD
jgi:hypothetical protein